MEQTIAQLIARATGAAFTATSRPALTFFLCQLAVALASRHGWVAMVPTMQWLVGIPMLVVGLVATVVEILIEHSAQIEELVRNVHGDKLWRVAGSFFVGLLLISIGVESGANGAAAATPQQLDTVVSLANSGQPAWIKALVVAGTVGVTQGLTWLRALVLGWLDDLHLKSLWQYVETGGVLGFLILLALSPILTVVLALVVTLVMVAVALAVRALDKRLDSSRRRACPSCGTQARDEALVCWSCKQALEPKRWLAPESSAGPLARMREAVRESYP